MEVCDLGSRTPGPVRQLGGLGVLRGVCQSDIVDEPRTRCIEPRVNAPATPAAYPHAPGRLGVSCHPGDHDWGLRPICRRASSPDHSRSACGGAHPEIRNAHLAAPAAVDKQWNRLSCEGEQPLALLRLLPRARCWEAPRDRGTRTRGEGRSSEGWQSQRLLATAARGIRRLWCAFVRA